MTNSSAQDEFHQLLVIFLISLIIPDFGVLEVNIFIRYHIYIIIAVIIWFKYLAIFLVIGLECFELHFVFS